MKIYWFVILACIGFPALGQVDSSAYLNNFQYTITWSGQGVVNGDTLAQLQCNLNVPDTTSIAAIMVKVGNFKGDDAELSYVFPLDPNYGLPSDYQLQINGNSVGIILGNHSPGNYYYTVRLYDSFGKKSNPLFYNPITNQLTSN